MADDKCPSYLSLRMYLSSSEKDFISIFFGVMSPIVVLTNMLLIILIIKARQTSLLTNYFIIALSIADTFIGLFLMPMQTILHSKYKYTRSCILEGTIIFLIQALFSFSGTMICAITFDRYIHICHPTKYGRLMTQRKAKVGIAACVLLTIALACTGIPAISRKFTSAHFVTVTGAFLVVGFIFALYIRSYMKLLKMIRANQMWSIPIGIRRRSSRQPQYLAYITKTVILILLSLFLCYVPYICITVVGYIQTEFLGKPHNPKLWFASYTFNSISYANSAINAVIILCRNRPIQRYLADKISPTQVQQLPQVVG